MHKNLLTIGLIISAQGPVLASNYDAHCDGSKWTVSIEVSGVSSSGGSIPMNRIAKWFIGGDESYSAAPDTAGFYSLSGKSLLNDCLSAGLANQLFECWISQMQVV